MISISIVIIIIAGCEAVGNVCEVIDWNLVGGGMTTVVVVAVVLRVFVGVEFYGTLILCYFCQSAVRRIARVDYLKNKKKTYNWLKNL